MAGILQEPFFSINFPQSVNFGSLGLLIGHELTHGIDESLREYDMNEIHNQWLRNKSIKAYNITTNCIVDQYSKYEINGDNIDGEYTLGN